MSVTAIIVTRGDVDLAPIIGQDWPDPVHEIVVWDNSTEEADLAVYGRYAAIERASHDLIWTQDDDCLLLKESIAHLIDVLEFLATCSKHGPMRRAVVKGYAGWVCDECTPKAFSPDSLVANMPQPWRLQNFYSDHCLVGFGACFHRDAPARAFERLFPDLLNPAPEDEWWNYRATVNGVTIEMPDSAFFHRTCDVVFTGLTPRTLVDVPYENLPHATSPERMYRSKEHVAERTQMIELVRKVRDAA